MVVAAWVGKSGVWVLFCFVFRKKISLKGICSVFSAKELLLLLQFPSQKQMIKILISVTFIVKIHIISCCKRGITVLFNFSVREWAEDKLHFTHCEPFFWGWLYKNTWVGCWLCYWSAYWVAYLLMAPWEDTGLRWNMEKTQISAQQPS